MGHGGVVANVACNVLMSVDQSEASITNIGQSEASNTNIGQSEARYTYDAFEDCHDVVTDRHLG